jgi:hypothetical protein
LISYATISESCKYFTESVNQNDQIYKLVGHKITTINAEDILFLAIKNETISNKELLDFLSSIRDFHENFRDMLRLLKLYLRIRGRHFMKKITA